jgi:hypothetical protein
MFEDLVYLRQYKEAADLVASKKDWSLLYNQAVLQENYVPVTAAVYYEVTYALTLPYEAISHFSMLTAIVTAIH